jgi:hypothetical protein
LTPLLSRGFARYITRNFGLTTVLIAFNGEVLGQVVDGQSGFRPLAHWLFNGGKALWVELLIPVNDPVMQRTMQRTQAGHRLERH